ncbi:MAG: protein kinase [Xenococcaceae cyanobacterium]
MVPVIGKKLQDGKYILNQELGEGGFGLTYQATNQILNQVVVIKTFKSSSADDTEVAYVRKQFLNESQRLVQCYHPNIVRFYEFFIEDEFPYIVMDYIKGKTLDRIILPDKPLSEATAITYIKQIGEALKIVHSKGLLHRDIKPQNLILRQNKQQVILIDFGIAREFNQERLQTHTNIVSDGYAPIEQYLPKAKRTPAIDIYGLAATLYTLVTAQIPIAATLRGRLTLDTPKDIQPELSDQISQAIMQGMALEQDERPSNVEEWLALLPQTEPKILPESEKSISLVETQNQSNNIPTVSQVKKPIYSNLIWQGLISFAAIVWGLDYVWLRFQAPSQNKQIPLNSVEKFTPAESPVIPTKESEPIIPEATQESTPAIPTSIPTTPSPPEEVTPKATQQSTPSQTTPSISTTPSPPKKVTPKPITKTTPSIVPSTPVSSLPRLTPPSTKKPSSKRVPSIFVSPNQKVWPKTNNSSKRVPSVFVSPSERR